MIDKYHAAAGRIWCHAGDRVTPVNYCILPPAACRLILAFAKDEDILVLEDIEATRQRAIFP